MAARNAHRISGDRPPSIKGTWSWGLRPFLGNRKHRSEQLAGPGDASAKHFCTESSNDSWDEGRCTSKNCWNRLKESLLLPEFWKGAWKNLKASWVSRLIRATKLSAMMVLAIHITLVMSYRKFLASNCVLLTYCLTSTILPEYSSSLYSAIWVWLLTIVVTFGVTLLGFLALYAGGFGGQVLALVVIFILFSWVTVLRIPLLYRVPPFREAIDSSHLGKFALIFIPYNSCCILLKIRNQLHTFEGTGDGIQYLFAYTSWSIIFTLLGLALFALQLATPPWNSQKASVRNKLKADMVQVSEALQALNEALELMATALTKADMDTFPAYKVELEVAAAAMATAVTPLLEILGSQSAVRTRLVESGREPYWLYPGPGINVMPEMARVQLVLLQASMHLVGAAKQLTMIVEAMDMHAVKRSRSLLSNIDEVCHSIKMARVLCKEGEIVLAIRPSHRRCTSYKEARAAAATRLQRLREHLEGVRFRSALGQGPFTRRPSVGAEIAERAQGLLQKADALNPQEKPLIQADTLGDEDAESRTKIVGTGDTGNEQLDASQSMERRTTNAYTFQLHESLPSTQPSHVMLADHYQPSPAETMPPHAWGKTAMKSRLRMLKPKTLKWHREHGGQTQLFPVEDGLVSEANSFIHLPTLDAQSSVAPSTSMRRTSSRGSLFENASLFETTAVDANQPDIKVLDEGSASASLQPASIPLTTTSVPSQEENGQAQDTLDAFTSDNNPVEALKANVGANTPTKPSTNAAVQEKNGLLLNVGVATNGFVESSTAAETAGVLAGEPAAREHSLVRDILGKSASAIDFVFDPAEDPEALVNHSDQQICRPEGAGAERDAMGLSRGSFWHFFEMGGSGKTIRGRPAKDALADVLRFPVRSRGVLERSFDADASPNSLDGAQSTWEAQERPVRYTSDTKALRFQVKLTMLVVSLIQLCNKDSLDFCQAFEALLYSDMTPSWTRFRLNIRMVFLSGTVMGMQLSRGVSEIFCFWKWRLYGENAWFNDVDIVHCLKFVVGITGLYAVGVFADKEITMWLVGSVDFSSAVMPVSSWLMLGFVCTMKWTFEGTVHAAISRFLGTLLGCLCVYGAMLSTDDYWMMLAWDFGLCFAAFFIFANSADVHSTFHPEFGYIGQVFLWTCVFIHQTVWISMETSPSTHSVLKLNVTNSRLGGNTVGILTAVFLSYWPPYFSSETEVRSLCRSLMGDCNQCISLIGASFATSVLTCTRVVTGQSSSGMTSEQQVKLKGSDRDARKLEDKDTRANSADAPPSGVCTEGSPRLLRVELTKPVSGTCHSDSFAPEQLSASGHNIERTLSHQRPCKRGREAKWKRGFCGIGFLAKPETFHRTRVSTKLHHENHQSKRREEGERRRWIRWKPRVSSRMTKSGSIKSHHSSKHLASSFECLQKAEEVLYRSFEPTLFLCRRLFLEGTKCPHSPLWWVDVSLGRILDLMDYLRMSIADSCEDFRDYLYASLSELNSAGAAGSAAFASCNLLMQTPHGNLLRRRFVELMALQKAAYLDIAAELISGQVSCWGRLPAFSICDCGRRQMSKQYLHAAKSYVRRRTLIESTLSAICAHVVECSRELRKRSGHSAQERRKALSVLLLLLHKIEIRHAVTDDIHVYIARSTAGRLFPERHLDELLQVSARTNRKERGEARRFAHVGRIS